ncbi:MAG: (Fe-S)-binding protein [bacterium]|nr:(Fe-S)-binding protein [bacterium]
MLSIPEKFLFLAFAGVALWYAYTGFRRVVLVIARGDRALAVPRWDHLPRRAGSALLRTLGQVTVFPGRPWVSLFHAFVFYGFVFYLSVNVVDAAHGLLPRAVLGALRFGVVGDLFRLFADVFGVLVLVGVAWLLLRRFVARDARLSPGGERVKLHEAVAAGGVQRDSLIVGVFILLHVGFRLVGEGFLLAYEGHADAWQPFASTLAAWIGPGEGRIVGWHVGWWGALGLVLAFFPYFPRSKHLHLFSAPVNLALDRRTATGAPVPYGVLEPLDLEDESAERFGVSHLEHLRVPQLLDAYACIQCHRCSEVCPANQTGKSLSPSALEINKRYELVANAAAFAIGEPSPRPLLEFAITEEAIWACTSCGACMDVCPVGCEPMIDIIDLRRYQVMTEGSFPTELQTAFRGLERNGNPWGLSPDKRMDWTEGLDVVVPTVAENPGFEVLFWVGCAGSYDPTAQATTRAMARLLTRAGINYAVLGKGETCTGDPARRAGNEYLYYQLASENVLVLNEALAGHAVDAATPKKVVTACPHCFHTLFAEYPQLGGAYEVVHHTDFLAMLVREGKLPPLPGDGLSVTYHDPCYAGRHHGIVEAPRELLAAAGAALVEMPRHGADSFCCGAGGAQFWKEEEPGDARVADVRYAEAVATGAAVVVTGCPFCRSMLGSATAAQGEGATSVRDIAVLLAERSDRVQARLDGAHAAGTG